MILATRTTLVLSAVLILGFANYLTANESNINFMFGSAFAQTDTTSGSNSSDPYAIPQNNYTDPYTVPSDNSTDPYAIPQYNYTNPYAVPPDNSTDPYAIPQDNSTALTNIQNQTSNVSTPEFGSVSVLVLMIGLISIILVSARSRFSWNIK